ncbi:MAG: cupin domain-containing protein [Gammaproteobacteria bacterium]
MPTNRQKKSDSSCHPAFPGDLSAEAFLRDYWQKQPLLIRQAFPDIESPLTPDELAGLACTDDANARIVFEQHEHGRWHVLHGPLHEDDFETLPEKNWTLLVTDVEKHVGAAKQLIDRFRFIPDWRIDDLMISYAPEGGSVGPHTDAYDVFLIQTQGQRRWMINKDFDDTCLEDTELRILQRFSAADEWILDPGDMLYLPPNVAHHGIALNECMTCSVGFRAPSLRNMISEYAEFIAASIDQSERYQDPDLQCQHSPGEIGSNALSRIKTLLDAQLTVDEDRLLCWFGEFSSEARAAVHMRRPDTVYSCFEDLSASLATDSILAQSPASKFLFSRHRDGALLFVDGSSYATSLAFARTLTDHRTISLQQLRAVMEDPADPMAVLDLYNNGCIEIL